MTTNNNTKPRRPGRPPVAGDVRKRSICVALPETLIEQLSFLANHRGVSRSHLISALLTHTLDKYSSGEKGGK